MKTIINGKMYDTDKAELIFRYSINPIPGLTNMGKFYIEIYRTRKQSYFKYDTWWNEIDLLSEDDVKNILVQRREFDKYVELFGEVEEG